MVLSEKKSIKFIMLIVFNIKSFMFFVSVSMSFINFPCYSGFFNDHARGWHWYEQRADENINSKIKKKKRIQTKPLTPSQHLEDFQNRLKEGLHRAIISPTPENIAAYMTLQKIMMDRAELFSKRWMEVVFTNPILDYTVKHPVNQVGIFEQSDAEKKDIARKIQMLAKTHGLFFFFTGSCRYCSVFAPIVKSFAQKHNLTVIAISMDGSKLKEFPDAKRDNGAAAKLGVNIFPTLLAVNPKNEKITPLSYGLSSHDQIEQRIQVLIE
jgi:conjugal transfer pilus assembly protein TraF